MGKSMKSGVIRWRIIVERIFDVYSVIPPALEFRLMKIDIMEIIEILVNDSGASTLRS